MHDALWDKFPRIYQMPLDVAESTPEFGLCLVCALAKLIVDCCRIASTFLHFNCAWRMQTVMECTLPDPMSSVRRTRIAARAYPDIIIMVAFTPLPLDFLLFIFSVHPVWNEHHLSIYVNGIYELRPIREE